MATLQKDTFTCLRCGVVAVFNPRNKNEFCSKSCVHSGKIVSAVARAKQSAAKAGRYPKHLTLFAYKKGHRPSPGTEFRRGENTGDRNHNWGGGKPDCADCGIQLDHYEATWCKKCAHAGERSVLWRGGDRDQRDRATLAYRRWRDAVYFRDGHTCQDCGATEARLNAHHIKPWRTHPEHRFDISNGVALCKSCHKRAEWKIMKAEVYHF